MEDPEFRSVLDLDSAGAASTALIVASVDLLLAASDSAHTVADSIRLTAVVFTAAEFRIIPVASFQAIATIVAVAAVSTVAVADIAVASAVAAATRASRL